MQLSAMGAQDIFLSTMPEITFFKIQYKRYTPFAIEAIEQTFNGTPGFNRKMTATLVRNGDLAAEMYLEITLTKSGPTYYPAEAIVQDVTLSCGGQQLDKHYASWFRVFDEMYRTPSEKAAYRRLVDFEPSDPVGCTKRFYLPLLFFCNRSKGSALPMVGLQFHEIVVSFSLGPAPTGIDPTVQPNATLWVDYVFLDKVERTRFAQQPHEYMIDQLQFTGPENAIISSTAMKSQQIRLNFNHPLRTIIWHVQGNDHGVFAAGPQGDHNDSLAPLYKAKLSLNGTDRFAERPGSYFSKVQPFQAYQASYPCAGLYCYNFALKPHEYQPTGSCNFSRIDVATMSVTWKQARTGATAASDINQDMYCPAASAQFQQVNFYGWGSNQFRVAGGMGGIAFAS